MILTCLKNWTPNTWHSDQPISNIATGKIATEAMGKNTASNELIYWEVYFTGGYNHKSYYAPIKKQVVKLFKEGNAKKKHSIPEDKGQSFADILSIFDNKSLDLRKNMEWSVTSKPWSKSRTNQKTRVGQIRNPFSEIIWSCYHRFHIQQLYPKVSTFQL